MVLGEFSRPHLGQGTYVECCQTRDVSVPPMVKDGLYSPLFIVQVCVRSVFTARSAGTTHCPAGWFHKRSPQLSTAGLSGPLQVRHRDAVVIAAPGRRIPKVL